MGTANSRWTTVDIPDQTGRTVLITGANSGLGLHSARFLAAKGAKLLLACRSPERARSAVSQVAEVAQTEPELIELDLADLGSVQQAAKQAREQSGDALDVLMNNAGVMATPHRRTKDGFELQLGTNHLGHAALTWLLMPALRTRPGARVVTLSSIAHQTGELDLDDPHFERRGYRATASYSQSKLANLLFARELDRRIKQAGLDMISVAAHPGMSHTELATNTVRNHSVPNALSSGVRAFTKLFAQSGEQGVLPQLYAATAADVAGGEYYGPDGFRGIRGYPTRAKPSRAARDDQNAQRLWAATAELTGIVPDPE